MSAADRGGRIAPPPADPSQATGRVKRRDNQLHRARVLEVRIQPPPSGESTNFWFLLITAGPGSQGRQPRAHQRAADRRDEALRISGPTGLTARSPTFSTFRTRWPRPAPGSSNRRCRPPKPPARPTAQPTILPPMTSTCAPMRCNSHRRS